MIYFTPLDAWTAYRARVESAIENFHRRLIALERAVEIADAEITRLAQ